MNLQAYRTLIALDEIGSFSRVAEQGSMTPSTVSMQMKALERSLDVQVFDRSVRPPRLTPLGRLLADRARRIVAEQDALLALSQTKGVLKGRYRIGFIATASVRLLPDFLAKARKNFPDAEFTIETGLSETLQDRVCTGQLDAAIVTRSDANNPKLTYATIRTEDLVYALPSGYAGEGIDVCMDDLAFILFAPQSGIGRLISSHLLSQGHPPRKTMVLDSVEAIMECVNAGIGFTILPRPDIDRYAGKGIGIVPVDPAPFHREVSIITAKGTIADQQADALYGLCL